ncbi:sigma-54-dependent transcriptional regulator [Halobacteriovorax sp.]|uniref:sigma-54-dependent transcriptional regulator n=1 Tax=Halobacteriovorax sp. TaxID=2020862 RepID=UPI00356B5195
MKVFSQDLEESSKYYSKITLKPLYGKTKEITLNRTEYMLTSARNDLFGQENYTLSLPTLANESIDLSLKWQSLEGKMYYFLKSLNGKPFRLNGNIVLNAIISDGDKVDIAHNRLIFNDSKKEIQEEAGFCERVIKSNLNILFEGETGTGKSYYAKKVHEESQRIGPFIHLNLASFSHNLIESEIFGHIKGSFTGATHDKAGALKEADYGTLFLDEIDSIPLDIQTKLLLFLDSKKYRRVGDNKESSVDVRLIFASGKSLKEMVTLGSFRKDMYFRISSGAYRKLNSLRNDRDRTRGLIEYYQKNRDCIISNRLTKFYLNLEWPGNIRQLFGHLDKKMIMTNGRKIDFDSLDEELIFNPFDSFSVEDHEYITYKELKVGYFNKVFTRVNGDYRTAAKKLDVSVNTVKNVLAKVG